MDINDLRILSTVFFTVAFISMLVWVFSKKEQEFSDAANLPFLDEDLVEKESRENDCRDSSQKDVSL